MAENVENKSDNEFTTDVVSSNFDASTEEMANATEKPLTEDEMRFCKHCDYQAPDWPVNSLGLFMYLTVHALEIHLALGRVKY